jgi:hypothetical protein
MKISGTVDATTLTLILTAIFFVLMLLVAEIFFKDDSQFFQVLSMTVSGIVGAILGRVKPEGKSIELDTKTD